MSGFVIRLMLRQAHGERRIKDFFTLLNDPIEKGY